MKKFFYCAVLLLLTSCGQDMDALFKCDMKQVTSDVSETALSLEEVPGAGVNARSVVIKDDFALSYEPTDEYLFSYSSIITGDLIGQMCRRGKSERELLSALPVTEIFKSEGDYKACIYSYMDTKVCILNISESLKTGKDIYDKVVSLNKASSEKILALKTCYYLGNDKILVSNSHQNPESEMMLDVPVYEVRDLESGECLSVLDGMFQYVPDLPVKNLLLSPKQYLSGEDCLSPDKSKLVYAMAYFPCYFIVDIESGKTRGFKLSGARAFNPSKRIWHFTSVQADEKFIYALYYGEDISGKDYDACPNMLYVFDWDGNVKHKFVMDHHFTDLSIDTDNDKLYFTHRIRSQIFSIDLDTLHL